MTRAGALARVAQGARVGDGRPGWYRWRGHDDMGSIEEDTVEPRPSRVGAPASRTSNATTVAATAATAATCVTRRPRARPGTGATRAQSRAARRGRGPRARVRRHRAHRRSGCCSGWRCTVEPRRSGRRGIETLFGWLTGLGRFVLPLVLVAVGVALVHKGRSSSPFRLVLGWGLMALAALGLLHVVRGPDRSPPSSTSSAGRRLARRARRRAARDAARQRRCGRRAAGGVRRRAAARSPDLAAHDGDAHRSRRGRRSPRPLGQRWHQGDRRPVDAEQRQGRNTRRSRRAAAMAGEPSALAPPRCTTRRRGRRPVRRRRSAAAEAAASDAAVRSVVGANRRAATAARRRAASASGCCRR